LLFLGREIPVRQINSFPRNLESIRKSPWNPHRPMGIHHSPHTHPTPIPMGIPMGIPIPTAALVHPRRPIRGRYPLQKFRRDRLNYCVQAV